MCSKIGSPEQNWGNKLSIRDIKHCQPKLNMMNYTPNRNNENDVNGGATRRRSATSSGQAIRMEQRRPDRQNTTATNDTPKRKNRKWTKEMNILVMECYLGSGPGTTGSQARFMEKWKEKGGFEVSQQILSNRVAYIKTRGWLTEPEIADIKRRCIETESGNVTLEPETEPETSIVDNNDQTLNSITQDEVDVNGLVVNRDDLTDEEVVILDQLVQKMENTDEIKVANLRRVPWKQVKEKTLLVNKVINRIKTRDIGETNQLILAGASVVKDLLGIKEWKKRKGEPWWKWRLKKKIADIRKDLSRAKEYQRGNLNQIGRNRLNDIYKVKKHGIEEVIETLKQRLKGTAARLRSYEAVSYTHLTLPTKA